MRKFLIVFAVLATTYTLFAQSLFSQSSIKQTFLKPLIAFSSDATPNDKQQIFIMDVNGDGVKLVCFKDLDCYNPRFSPDGKTIVFCATNIVSDFIYMIDLNDSSTFRFPKFVDGGTDPVFSPDGRYLMYRSEKNDNNAVYILDIKTDESFPISDGSLSTHAEFSPDGNKVIYSSSLDENFDLVVLDLNDTSDNAQKTIANSKDAEIYGTFSPDGRLVAYSSFDVNYKGSVHICSTDGNNNITVSKGMGSSYNPKFSPDGSMLAFVSDKSGNFEIYTCYPDGSGLTMLTNKNGNTVEFDWSADSKKIVFESMHETVSSINVIDIETGSSENLTGEKANNINPCIQK
jgi:Tol biopolymer transport system component